MSALIPTGAIHVYTHDSIGLGEDGPTHQPVEHTASLRLIPKLQVWRPADKVETMVAWGHALRSRKAPTALILTRQGLPHQPRDAQQIADIERGGYVLKEAGGGDPKAVIIATGSEVGLAVEAATELEKAGTPTRVVSMPNPGLFRAQDATYRQAVLPTELTARVAIEAGVSDYWYGFVGDSGRVIGIDQYGASAPAGDLFREYGFTVEAVVDAVNGVVGA
jgi:transketolase